jgi:hypothetical protein
LENIDVIKNSTGDNFKKAEYYTEEKNSCSNLKEKQFNTRYSQNNNIHPISYITIIAVKISTFI